MMDEILRDGVGIPKDIPSLLAKINLVKWADFGLEMALKIVLAIIILVVGWVLARQLRRVTRRALTRARIDITLAQFLANIVYAIFGMFVIIAALNNVGVQTASLVALIGAAGLAVGLALQGSLSNFAAGVMIIMFKHFRVGDVIKTNEVEGTVSNLDIFNTIILTYDNQKVVVPNARLTENAITNFSGMTQRRINITVGISYKDDIRHAKSVIQKLIDADTRILLDPAPLIAVNELGESSVNLVVRVWCKTTEYHDVRFALLENIKYAMDEAGITIPFPQRELRIISSSASIAE